METIIAGLQEYGILGILLAYFLWQNTKIFEMFTKTMQEIVMELKLLREKQETNNREMGIMSDSINELKNLTSKR